MTFRTDIRLGAACLRGEWRTSLTILLLICCGLGLAIGVLMPTRRALAPPFVGASHAILVQDAAEPSPRGLNASELGRLMAASPRQYEVGGVLPPGARGGSDFVLVHGIRRSVRVSEVAGDMFNIFGMRPIIGRTFSSLESEPLGGYFQTAVVSWSFWKSALGGDPNVVGSVLSFYGQPYFNGGNLKIIGVMPRGAQLPQPADLWVPLATFNTPWVPAHSITAIVLPRGDISVSRARQQIAALLAPRSGIMSVSRRLPVMKPFLSAYFRPLRRLAALAMIAAAAILAAIIVDLALLGFFSFGNRRPKFVLSIALGADMGNLSVQWLAWAGVICLVGGLGAWIVTQWVSTSLLQRLGALDPRIAAAPAHGYGGTLALAIALITSFLIWAVLPLLLSVPAIRRGGAAPILRASGAPGLVVRPTRLRMVLLLFALQAGLATCLLFIGAAALASFQRAKLGGLGYEPDGLYDVPVLIPRQRVRGGVATAALIQALGSAVRRQPGISAASESIYLPVGSSPFQISLQRVGRPTPTARLAVEGVGPGYFQTLRIPLVAGRDFDNADSFSRIEPMVIDTGTDRILFGSRRSIGAHVTVPGSSEFGTVVGVAQTVRSLVHPRPTLYVPIAFLLASTPTAARFHLLLRSPLTARALRPIVTREIARVMPNAEAGRIAAFGQLMPATYRLMELQSIVCGPLVFALLLIVAAGFLAVGDIITGARMREFCIRAAIGAPPGSLVRLFFRDLLLLVAPVAVLGGWLGMIAATFLPGTPFRFGGREDLALWALTCAVVLALGALTGAMHCRRLVGANLAWVLHTE